MTYTLELIDTPSGQRLMQTHDNGDTYAVDIPGEDWELVSVQKTNANPEGDPSGPIDVWLKFETLYDDATGDDYEEASHEANTYLTETGYAVKWYHSAVGLVTTVDFDTLADAYDWYEANGYQDFTVAE